MDPNYEPYALDLSEEVEQMAERLFGPDHFLADDSGIHIRVYGEEDGVSPCEGDTVIGICADNAGGHCW